MQIIVGKLAGKLKRVTRNKLYFVARRSCPKCGKVVEIMVEHVGNKVVKRCPNCGYVFIEYEVRSSLPPSTELNREIKEQYRFE
ncbi:hypothetical protein V6M85_09395 [Sulfolobus tengchongensis]|uniref:Uncharacterized protein n=1 Tax=Sulfolobus tengchongensis TaxID=207809 RepID=A0AAX4KYD2_9CREN